MSIYIENPTDTVPIASTGPISFTLLRNTFGPDVNTCNLPMKLSYILSDTLPLNQSSNLNSFRGKYLPEIAYVYNTTNAVKYTGGNIYEEVDTVIAQNTNFSFRRRDFKYLSTSNILVQHTPSTSYDSIFYLKSSVAGIGTTTVQISRNNFAPIINTTYNNKTVGLDVVIKKRNNFVKTIATSTHDANDLLTTMRIKFNTTLTASAVQTYHGHHHAQTGYGGNGNKTCAHHGGSSTGPCSTQTPYDGTHHTFYSCGGDGSKSCTHHGGSATGPCTITNNNNGQHHTPYPCGGNNAIRAHNMSHHYHTADSGQPGSHTGYHHTGVADQEYVSHSIDHCKHCNKRNRTGVHHNVHHDTGHGLYKTNHQHNVNHTHQHHHGNCGDHYAGHLIGHGCFHHGRHTNNCIHTPQHTHNCIHTNKTHHSITYRTSSSSVSFQNIDSDINASYFTTTLLPDTSLSGSCNDQRTITYIWTTVNDENRAYTANPHTSISCTSRYKLSVKPNWINKTYTDIKGVSLTYN